MQHFRIDDMVGGWFVGSFTPSAYSTTNAEVAVKRYRAGDKEGLHHHKVATEITLVLSGKVRMVGAEWSDGDIIVLEPCEATAFEAITDAVCVVVKIPGVLYDKYLGEAS